MRISKISSIITYKLNDRIHCDFDTTNNQINYYDNAKNYTCIIPMNSFESYYNLFKKINKIITEIAFDEKNFVLEFDNYSISKTEISNYTFIRIKNFYDFNFEEFKTFFNFIQFFKRDYEKRVSNNFEVDILEGIDLDTSIDIQRAIFESIIKDKIESGNTLINVGDGNDLYHNSNFAYYLMNNFEYANTKTGFTAYLNKRKRK